MQSLAQSDKICFTKKQIKEVEEFKQSIENGSAKIAFEGSLLEGKAYLKGIAEIVKATSHS